MIAGWYITFPFEQSRIKTGKTERKKFCTKNRGHGTFTKAQHQFCPTCGSPLEEREVDITRKGPSLYEFVSPRPHYLNDGIASVFVSWDEISLSYLGPFPFTVSEKPTKEDILDVLQDVFQYEPFPEYSLQFGFVEY